MNKKIVIPAITAMLAITAITTVCVCGSEDITPAQPSEIGVSKPVPAVPCTSEADMLKAIITTSDGAEKDATIFTNREFNSDEWTAVTATWYCPCYKCCGKWAIGRPLHEDGTEIVYGAYGDELKDGISIASSVYPAGTVLEIYGIGTRIVQDCGVSHSGVDFYTVNHELAIENGVQTVYIREVTK